MPYNLSTFITLPVSADGYVWGYASARDCIWSNYDSGDARTIRHAVDFDLNWQNQGRASNFPGLKHISVKPQNRPWPNLDTTADWVVTLPNNALIKNIYVYRPAGARAESYQLNVGNGDESTTYANDGAGLNSNVAHTIVVEKTIATLISAGTTNPNNQVKVWANPHTTDSDIVTGGYFIVEYY